MLGLGISTTLTPTGAGSLRGATQLFVINYTQYVVNNNAGIVEATSCLTADMFNLGIRNTGDYINLIFQRFIADGGVVEGQACFTNALFDLNSYIEIAWNTSIEVWSTTTDIWNL